MPSIRENLEMWDGSDWSHNQEGEKWSAAWGSSEAQWFGSLYFRLHPFLPCDRILEIGPGHGRWTQYLKGCCRELHIVDVSANCIAACRRRFAEAENIRYHVNDGRSLAMVPGPFDLAFSFDSLVHVELDVLAAYVGQLAELLCPDGVAFLHHSNLGEAMRGPLAAVSREALAAAGFNAGRRAESVDAAGVSALAADHDLALVAQELVRWGGEGPYDRGLHSDCFSLLARRGSRWERAPRVLRNERPMPEEARYLLELGELYCRSSFAAPVTAAAAAFAAVAQGEPPSGAGERPASNFGRWDDWYGSVERIEPYGDSDSYRLGAEFLSDCAVVEDWGCGKAWFSKFRPEGYVGVDGSRSPFASRVVDLVAYTSSVDGIFMRHVLEHNYEWQAILRNALKSFHKKMVLVLYTPWSEQGTRELAFIRRVGVPELSFAKDDLVALLDGFTWELVELTSPTTIYGVEHLFLIRRP